MDGTLILVRSDQQAVLIDGELAIQSIERPLTCYLPWGTAQLTPPRESFSLMASNQEGFIRIEGPALAALGQRPTLQLKPWGCVEGSGEAGASLSLREGPGIDTYLQLNYRTRVAPGGGFHFCKVPAGELRLSLAIEQQSLPVSARWGVSVGPIVLPSAPARKTR